MDKSKAIGVKSRFRLRLLGLYLLFVCLFVMSEGAADAASETPHNQFSWGSGKEVEGVENTQGVSGYNGVAAEVVIPSKRVLSNVTYTTTYIRSEAFEGNTTIQTVVIPDTVVEIGANAFKGCTNLQYVVIGAGVKRIHADAFTGCSSLKYLVIPDNVTYIAPCAVGFSETTSNYNATMFSGTKYNDFTIVCTENCKADEYAKANGNDYKNTSGQIPVTYMDPLTFTYTSGGNVAITGCTNILEKFQVRG